MSTKKKLLEAAAGAAGGEAVYVDDVFSTYLYAGTGSSQNIVTGIDLSGEGGLVWTKSRTSAVSNQLTDTVSGYRLESDDTYAGEASQGNVTFNSNGHTQATGSSFFNDSGNDFVNWTFRKAPGFFDIVTYTGDGGSNRAISHNLASKPGLVIIKTTSMAAGWMVGTGFTSTQYYRLALETSGAASGGGLANYDNYLSAEPTTTTFSVGNEGLGNANGQGYVAYLFANDAQDFGTDSDEAIIKCGSYTGNGSTNGPTIDLGFEPQWLLIKNATASSNWMMVDNMRGLPVGGDDATLAADTSDAENGVIGAVAAVNILPNGWKNVGGVTASNANGATHIYMAIRRPNKPAEEFAATDLFAIGDRRSVPASEPQVYSGFPVDMAIRKDVTAVQDNQVYARFMGSKRLGTNSTSAEVGVGGMRWDYMDGYWEGDGGAGNPNEYSWMWKRAPGFFDVVTYTGTGSATTIAHNLGVAPEMIWHKVRSATGNWQLYLNAGGTEYGFYGLDQKYVGLNTSLSSWNNTSPTDSVVSISSGLSNSSQTYIMYLFASVPGISKIGTYSGTGSELTVDCGFSAGARYVLIKRADNSMGADGESYFVFDTVRGITSSSSSYLALNDTDAQVTGSFIKPSSGGFIVTSQSVVNTNGSTYAFYAIA